MNKILKKIKYKYLLLGVISGLVIEFIFEVVLISITNIFNNPPAIIQLSNFLIILPLLLGALGYYFDFKSKKDKVIQNYIDFRYLYICSIFASIFPLFIIPLNSIIKKDFINRIILYIPNLITGHNYGDAYTNSLIIGTLFLLIFYPLLIILLGIIIDLIRSKIKKSKND